MLSAWVQAKLDEISEDDVYASIEANDREAYEKYMTLQAQFLTTVDNNTKDPESEFYKAQFVERRNRR